MNKVNKYVKVASYEGKVGEVKKIVLLYSGGLDTSVMLKWIQDNYKAKVITLTLNLGQQRDDLEAVKNKALKLGAVKAITLDAREEFARDYISKGIKANSCYQGNYHLSTAIGRAIIAKKAVEVAKREGADCVAHGCTGKGNDQVRIDSYITTLDSTIKIIAPVREWNMDRNEEILYAKKHKIPVPATVNFPYSDDDNMWGITWEGGEIVNPALIPPVKKFLTTYNTPDKAPNKRELVKIGFQKGIPFSFNGKKMKISELIMKLNKVVGRHGVGTFHILEDRLVGLKNRGVYEQPAAHVIIEAHKNLEKYVSTRTLNELKQTLDIKWSYACYGSLWYDPMMQAINAFNDDVNKKVTGTVTVQLFKGIATVVALTSPFALDYVSFNNNEGYKFNVNNSASFIEIYSLQMKLANKLKDNKK